MVVPGVIVLPAAMSADMSQAITAGMPVRAAADSRQPALTYWAPLPFLATFGAVASMA